MGAFGKVGVLAVRVRTGAGREGLAEELICTIVERLRGAGAGTVFALRDFTDW